MAKIANYASLLQDLNLDDPSSRNKFYLVSPFQLPFSTSLYEIFFFFFLFRPIFLSHTGGFHWRYSLWIHCSMRHQKLRAVLIVLFLISPSQVNRRTKSGEEGPLFLMVSVRFLRTLRITPLSLSSHYPNRIYPFSFVSQHVSVPWNGVQSPLLNL